MRIAFAAAALCYIAPHFGIHLSDVARPLLADAQRELTPDAIGQTVIAYCQKNPEICIRIARSSLGSETTPSAHESTPNAELRLGPAKLPLPPHRPVDLRPALKS